MDNIQSTEWMLLMALMLHLVMAPGTKVEESFNVQAIHDILYHRLNFSAYDHHQFPGVVPRTFIGPLAVSSILMPFIDLCKWLDVSKLWILCAARLTLGAAVLLMFCNLARCVDKHFGRQTGNFLRLITATQFHFLFYASRPLPNIFALVGVLWVFQLWMDGEFVKAVRVATAFTALFRCELVLLFGCVFFVPIVTRKLPLVGSKGAIVNGLLALFVTLGISVPIDSLLWNRWLWPEGEVWWFNVVLNKSQQYGISPFFWYFYSALPRALLASIVLVPVGLLLERRLWPYVMPVAAYVLVYSVLPHKELRFIIYAFPIFNVAAATACCRLWQNRQKSWLRYIIALAAASHLLVNIMGTSTFLYASSWNYPGTQALGYLQFMQRFDRNKPISVYIDNFAAQTGVSRFLQLYDAWEYNKTESLQPPDLKRFDFLLIGSYAERDIVAAANRNFSETHRLLYSVKAFQKIKVMKLPQPPYYFPYAKLADRMVVLKKLD